MMIKTFATDSLIVGALLTACCAVGCGDRSAGQGSLEEVSGDLPLIEALELSVSHSQRVNMRGHSVSLTGGAAPCEAHGCPDFRWVKIPAGSLKMGSNHGDADETPVHSVSMGAFLIAESEVTVAQYRKCVEADVCTVPKIGGACTWGRQGHDDHPVNCVDWGQARTFSRWVGGDLPTEAQWEYAARGGENYEYAGSNSANEVAWHSGNTSSPQPVKQRRANAYGLYDMSGNMWEWTLDEWHNSYRGAPSTGEQPWGIIHPCGKRCGTDSSRRVNRGGSWSNGVKLLRVSLRDRDNADKRDGRVGFRPRISLTSSAPAKPQGLRRVGPTETKIKWVTIPSGSFQMGSTSGDADETPVRAVSVKRFKIAESEVTVAQYRACVDAGVCTLPKTGDACTWGQPGRESHPVNCVDWAQARTFSRWVGGELPTEAQWEYAARGGEGYEYAGSNDAAVVAWYSSNTETTQPVKTKQPNGYKLYDMSGSVWEWTLDAWHSNYAGAPTTAEQAWVSLPDCVGARCSNDSARHVNRGGSWANGLKLLRVSLRDRDDADTRTKLVGFRPVIPSVPTTGVQASVKTPTSGCRGADCSKVKWVTIPAGSFQMGSTSGDADETPVRAVSVKRFKIAESEVTVAQYRACVDAGVCTLPQTGRACTWGKPGHENHPVNCVDWGQARTFSRWVGGELPTEAQWEYAARGGEGYEYAGSNDASEVAWHSSNTETTQPVKTKYPNGYKLYDMSGNVWEWTLDAWHNNYSGAPATAEQAWVNLPACVGVSCSADSVRHVNRGGCWANGLKMLRVALRDRDDASEQSKLVGFRPVIPSVPTTGMQASFKAPASGCRGEACSKVKWVTIPAGSFQMGSTNGDADEMPVRAVSVKRFKIAESEVTVAQYRACVDAGVCTRPNTGSMCTWGKLGHDDHPVNCVDWAQARTFSRWVGGDLPTEAQWEYAARGGEGYEYAGANDASEVAWYSSNTETTQPVKTKRPNGYKLYDMSGSVWEWTLDAWHSNYSGAPTTAERAWAELPSCSGVRCSNDTARHVNRGGSWANGLKMLRVSLRDRDDANERTKLVGFRPVISSGGVSNQPSGEPKVRPRSKPERIKL